MPPLLPAPVRQLELLAERWHKEHPGAGGPSLEARLADVKARAAFFVATALPLADRPAELPLPSICDTCGVATHGWCEGLLSEVG